VSIDSSTERFEQKIAVMPRDIDFQGRVNNLVYVRWVQDMSTAHWNARTTAAEQETIGWVVIRHEIDYLRPARLGDEITGRTWVGVARKNIFERHVEFIRASDLKPLARACSLWCPVDMSSFRPMRVPEDIYERFSSSRV
jgi:acyl-CoA thioester hydrolase